MFHELVIKKFNIHPKEELKLIIKICDHLNYVNLRLNWKAVQNMIDFYSSRKGYSCYLASINKIFACLITLIMLNSNI